MPNVSLDHRNQPAPREVDVDVVGLTNVGRVRHVNQDHFLVASLHKTMRIWDSSLPDPDQERLRSEPHGGLALVADGVGGGAAGEEASEATLATVTEYVTHTMDCFRHFDSSKEESFLAQLRAAVRRCHEAVCTKGAADPSYRGMATTLTMVYTLWPNAFVVQVGDSRCYQLRDGVLRLLTKDQTVAQKLYDEGVFTTQEVDESPLGHVLYSAIGGPEATPVTTRFDLRWGDVLLLCTDGLTKHVSDAEISDTLVASSAASDACRELVSTALDRGGTDNVTVVVVRTKPRPTDEGGL